MRFTGISGVAHVDLAESHQISRLPFCEHLVSIKDRVLSRPGFSYLWGFGPFYETFRYKRLNKSLNKPVLVHLPNGCFRYQLASCPNKLKTGWICMNFKLRFKKIWKTENLENWRFCTISRHYTIAKTWWVGVTPVVILGAVQVLCLSITWIEREKKPSTRRHVCISADCPKTNPKFNKLSKTKTRNKEIPDLHLTFDNCFLAFRTFLTFFLILLNFLLRPVISTTNDQFKPCLFWIYVTFLGSFSTIMYLLYQKRYMCISIFISIFIYNLSIFSS